MAGKSFSVSFNINGSLDGTLAAAIHNAANAMRGLGNAAKTASASAQASKSGLQGMANALNQLNMGATRFKALDAALKQTTADFSKSTAALNAAKENFNQQTQAAEKLRQKLAELQAERDKAKTNRGNERTALNAFREQRRALREEYKAVDKSFAQYIADFPKKGFSIWHKKLEDLKAQLQANQTAIENQRAKFQETGKAYADLTAKIKQAKAELKPLAEAEKQSGDSLAQVRRNAEWLKQSYQQQFGALSQLKAALSSAGVNVSHLAQEEARLQGEINRVNAALERQAALNQARANSSAAAQEMFNAYNNFQNALQTAETIASPFKAAIDNASEFEYAMSQVKALTQMRNIRTGDMERVREEMEDLRTEAERLGATTEFTSLEVAKAMGYYGMAGWDKNRIISAMQSTLDLATIAGDHNIPRTADVFSDAMTALGMQAGRSMQLTSGKIVEESAYFTDAFAYAITQANLNREQLFEALKYNAPTSHAAGLSLGETLAMNMISANAGIKGSMAGTAFRAGWTRFLAPPKTAAKALAEMGMTASDATREVLEAGAALESIGVSADSDLFTKITKAYEHYQTLDKNGQAGFLTSLVGRNALSAWQTVFDKGNIEQIAKIANEIDSGAIEGWAKDTADVMRDNTKTSIELLESSIDALQNRIGTALLPAVRATAEAFAPIVTAAAEWIAENPAVVQAAAAIAATLATVIVAAAGVKLAFAGWKFVGSSIELVSKALTGLARAAIAEKIAAMAASLGRLRLAIMGAARAALAFAFSPVGAALMALALAGLYCYQNWDKVAPVLDNIAQTLGGVLNPAIDSAMQACSILASTIGEAFAPIMPILSNIADYISKGLGGAFIGLLGVVASVISGIVVGLAGLIKTLAELGTGITRALYYFSEGNLAKGFETLAETGKTAAENFKAAWADSFSAVEKGIKATEQGLDALNRWKDLPSAKVMARHQVQSTVDTTPTTAEKLSGLPNAAAVARHQVEFDESGAAHTKPIDTKGLQTAANELTTSVTAATSAAAGLPVVASGMITGAKLAEEGFALAKNAAEPAQAAAISLASVNNPAQNLTNTLMQASPATQALTLATQTASTATNELVTSTQGAGAAMQWLREPTQTLTASLMQASPATQALAVSSQNAATSTSALGNSAASSTGNIDALSNSAAGSTGNINSMSGAASSASGSISGLGAAAASAINSLLSAGSAAASAVSSAASSALNSISTMAGISAGIRPSSNAKGGIYGKGTFLTTFAEKSPEAAIPIEHTARAYNLWRQTGNLLGVSQDGAFGEIKRDSWSLPTVENSSPINITLNITIEGNADENVVRRGFEQALPRVRDFARELAAYNHERARRSFA